MDKVKITKPTVQDQRQYLQLSFAERSCGLKTLSNTKNNLFKNKTNARYNIYSKN